MWPRLANFTLIRMEPVLRNARFSLLIWPNFLQFGLRGPLAPLLRFEENQTLRDSHWPYQAQKPGEPTSTSQPILARLQPDFASAMISTSESVEAGWLAKRDTMPCCNRSAKLLSAPPSAARTRVSAEASEGMKTASRTP
jgi:hypothetical protein